ncbi:MAG: hypothetical protein LBN05_04075 [Oscillospiraceae bacterium]|nr:hypothetical protein [Oscillospiraceae bacterium]
MAKNRWGRILLLNGGIAAVDIIVFAKPFLGLTFSGLNAFKIALAATAVLMSAVVFLWGNYKLLQPKNAQLYVGLPSNQPLEEWLPLLRDARRDDPAFQPTLKSTEEQVERFGRMRQKTRALLAQKFSAGEMTYARFDGAVTALEGLLSAGIRAIFAHMAAFDEEEFTRLRRMDTRTGAHEARFSIYQDSIHKAYKITESNEEVLLKLDMLVAEISGLGAGDSAEHSRAMEEIDQLIKSAKYYDAKL